MRLRNVLFLVALAGAAQLSYGQHIIYTSPVPGSSMVSLKTNIILRCDADIDRATLVSAPVEVRGTTSGLHEGKLSLSDDEQTILFLPALPLAPGEEVRVTLLNGIRTTGGAAVNPMSYTFRTTSLQVPLTERYYVDTQGAVVEIGSQVSATGAPQVPGGSAQQSLAADVRQTLRSGEQLAASPAALRPVVPGLSPEGAFSALDSLPADFPSFKVDTTDNPAPGYFFLATEEAHAGVGYYIFMIDNNGKVVRYKRSAFPVLDFKQHPNGLLSYAESYSPWIYAGGGRTVHRVLDSTLAPVDSFRCGNGYDADSHEFVMLPNGHVLLHAYDIQYMDLSGVVAGGNPNAVVVGSILQELDRNKNVVFQWRSWDYVPISDTYNNVASAAFDYIHVNGYDVDGDGNIVACFRVTCQILKINRMSGEIMWRWGGRRNEFAFIGENPANAPTYLSYPHSVRRLPNGNFILFDNGNQHTPQASRAAEYRLDQVNKTATLVWEYRHTPDLFGPQMGSVQRLPNGNTLIGWGNASLFGTAKTALTEVRPDKSIAFEMQFLDGTITYRAWKHVLAAQASAGATVSVFDVQPGNTYHFRRGDSVLTGISMLIVQGSTGYSNLTVKSYTSAPVKPAFDGLPPFADPRRWVIRAIGLTGYIVDVTFDSTALAPYTNRHRALIYARDVEGTGTFAPLATTYDSAAKSLTVTVSKFGEFIIGVPDQVSPPPVPALVLPVKDATVNQSEPILIRWSTAGHLTGSHLQIAADSLFATSLVDDSTLRSSVFVWTGAAHGATYVWRVRARNELGTSDWSASGRFSTAAPYITVTSPKTGDKLSPGSTAAIRWESNLNAVGTIMSIRLYRNGSYVSRINDSTVSSGRYQWRVGTALTTDSTYTIRVRLFKDSTIYAESGVFTIAPATGVEEDVPFPGAFGLDQNYPNPFNPATTIRFRVPAYGNNAPDSRVSYERAGSNEIRLAVYDILGREAAVLVEGTRAPGEHEAIFDGSRLSSGVYFYRLMVRGSGGTESWQTLFTRTMMMVK